MIHVTVVGGFLGAGKTTWLSQRLLDEGDLLANCSVVSNDFAAEGVDNWLLAAESPHVMPEVLSITGGCICCDAREELLHSLIALTEVGHRKGESGLARIFIETSGVADPVAVVQHIATHPVLRHNMIVDEFVCVLDGATGRAQLLQGRIQADQLSTADKIVITKADVADPRNLLQLQALAASAAPAADVHGSSYGRRHPLPVAQEHDPVPQLVQDSNPRGWETPTATVLFLSPGVIWEEYALWLEMLLSSRSEQILRTKGTIMTPRGPIVLQSVGAVIQQPISAPDIPRTANGSTSMVFITRGFDPGLLEASLARFVPSAAIARGKSE
ncbi:CobW family GTP-binding protein [Paenarthrobacter sp. NPDC089675]|uniref:CobW family GTP-binding protein n=1 Tax=Paenarthrobacter sp. NPDC089675 TaxID=3364376 RepID=UPI00381DBAFA